jgi:hypothetical protein
MLTPHRTPDARVNRRPPGELSLESPSSGPRPKRRKSNVLQLAARCGRQGEVRHARAKSCLETDDTQPEPSEPNPRSGACGRRSCGTRSFNGGTLPSACEEARGS